MSSVSTYRFSRALILEQAPAVRRAVLLGVIAGVPLIFLRFPNDPFNVPKLALLFAGTGVAAAIRVIEILQGRGVDGLKRLWFPAVVVAVPLVLAWASGPYRYWSLFGHYGRFQGLIPYLVVIVFGVLVADAFAGRAHQVAWALTIAGAVAGGYAVVQFIGIDPFRWAQQFGGEMTQTSTLGNPNFTGGFLAIVLPVAAVLWFTDLHNRRRLSWLGGFIVGGQILSFSQGGYVATVAGAAVLAGFYFADRWGWARVAGGLVAGALAVGIVAAVGYAMTNPGDTPLPLTTEQRALWWRGAVSMTTDHPILGRGPNAYAVEGFQHRPVEDSAVHGLDFSDDTHSVWLAFLTGAGVVGLAGFAAVAGWTVVKARGIESDDLLVAGFVAAAAAYFVQALVSIDEVALRTTFWAVLGGLGAALVPVTSKATRSKKTSAKKTSAKKTPAKKKKTSARRVQGTPVRALPAVALIALGGIVALWWGGAFILADARVRWATDRFRFGQPQAAQDDFERALGFRGEYGYRQTDGFFLGRIAVNREEAGEVWLEQAEEAFSFVDDFPSVPALLDYARALRDFSEFEPGLIERSADLYARAWALDPFNVAIAPEAVATMADAGRHADLVDALEDRIDVLEERSPYLWANLALSYDRLGRSQQSEAALEQALTLAPEDPAVIEARDKLRDSP